MRPELLHLIRQWTAKADEDYRNAEFVLAMEEDCPLSTICFHSQQCVEKYLKALLISWSLPVPRSHDLLELYHRIPAESRPRLPETGLAVLNRYAVETRYSGDWDVISREEGERAFGLAKAARMAIARELGARTNRDESF